VADVGAGTGALLSAIRSAAPGARVVAVDASAQMLRVARARRGASAILADALDLPLADATADAVILAYVLFHLSDPSRAVAEAARVLRPTGRVATVTWAWERGPHAHTVWDQILADAGAPPAPPRHADAGLDLPGAVEELLRAAGFRPERIWSERLRRQWDRSSYCQLASSLGANHLRLSVLDPAARADVLARVHRELGRLGRQDFLWEGEVICAVAAKSHAGCARGSSAA
jgi:SAM-dependent methyltransferase